MDELMRSPRVVDRGDSVELAHSGDGSGQVPRSLDREGLAEDLALELL